MLSYQDAKSKIDEVCQRRRKQIRFSAKKEKMCLTIGNLTRGKNMRVYLLIGWGLSLAGSVFAEAKIGECVYADSVYTSNAPLRMASQMKFCTNVGTKANPKMKWLSRAELDALGDSAKEK